MRVLVITGAFVAVSAFWYSGAPLAARSLGHPDPLLPAAVLMGGMLISEWALLLPLLRWLRRHGHSLGDLGWGRPVRLVPLGIALVVAMLFCAAVAPPWSRR